MLLISACVRHLTNLDSVKASIAEVIDRPPAVMPPREARLLRLWATAEEDTSKRVRTYARASLVADFPAKPTAEPELEPEGAPKKKPRRLFK